MNGLQLIITMSAVTLIAGVGVFLVELGVPKMLAVWLGADDDEAGANDPDTVEQRNRNFDGH